MINWVSLAYGHGKICSHLTASERKQRDCLSKDAHGVPLLLPSFLFTGRLFYFYH